MPMANQSDARTGSVPYTGIELIVLDTILMTVKPIGRSLSLSCPIKVSRLLST